MITLPVYWVVVYPRLVIVGKLGHGIDPVDAGGVGVQGLGRWRPWEVIKVSLVLKEINLDFGIYVMIAFPEVGSLVV
jgi:hypothetical protein